MNDYRESIWGIRPEDRRWFQLLTLLGGIGGSVILTYFELDANTAIGTSNVVARNITLGIGSSFVASGFIAWGLLQAKEMVMPIGDWIREDAERRREKWRRKMLEEGYKLGYKDAQEGKPPQPPGTPRNGNQSGTGRQDDHSEDQ